MHPSPKPGGPDHFRLARRLMVTASHFVNDADVWLVFSSAAHRLKFCMDSNCTTLSALVIEDNVSENLWAALQKVERQFWVHLKKFFAIQQLQYRYEFCVTIDSETLIVREMNTIDAFRKYYNKKTYHSQICGSWECRMVQKTCLRYFAMTLLLF